MLTQARVKELFDYNDGKLIRKIHKSGRAKIDDIAGSAKGNGYLATVVDGSRYYNHRLVWLWHHGYMPENAIDHIDRNTLNNRIDNLREVSVSCNLRNSKTRTDNTSGVRGVHWFKRVSKWKVRIVVNNKEIHLGYCSDFIEAVCLRLAAEQVLNWEGCDSTSSAYQYVRAHVIGC